MAEDIGCHNHHTCWRQKLPMFDLTLARAKERLESCVLTPDRASVAKFHSGNFYGAFADAGVYRNAAS